MGKKMGENSKAVAARDRKNEKEQQQKAVKEKAMEDAKWADDDKALAKKQVGNDCSIIGNRRRFEFEDIAKGVIRYIFLVE